MVNEWLKKHPPPVYWQGSAMRCFRLRAYSIDCTRSLDRTHELGFAPVVLRSVSRTLEFTQGKASVEGTGRVLIQLTQGTAAGAVFTLSGGPGASVILFGPALAARLLTNPTFARWLTIGLKAKPGSPAAQGAFGQMVALAARQGAAIEPAEEPQDLAQ